MKAIILAAGRGSRMGERTSELPKCRTKFLGKELVQWQLEALEGAGLRETSIVTGYLNETFDFPVKYFHNSRWSQTNMVMSLVEASPWLEKDDCIISYSDIVYSKDAVKTLMEQVGDIVVLYDPNWLKLWNLRFEDPLDDAESFKLKENVIIDIGQKSESVDDIEGQFMGLIKMTPLGFSQIQAVLKELGPEQQDKLDFTSLLQMLIKAGVKLSAAAIKDQWYEVDSESDLYAYERTVKKGSAFDLLS